ncbi:MAG: hypothetical protein ACJ76B_06435 [Solirubrobacterales bacterium]
MTVMTPRQNWTDERLDHFEKHVDERFDRIDADIRELRAAVLGMQRVMVQGTVAVCTVMAGGFAALAGGIG